MVDSFSIIDLVEQDTTSIIPEETSFTTFITRHFNLQSSTKNAQKLSNKYLKQLIDEDMMDDGLFS